MKRAVTPIAVLILATAFLTGCDKPSAGGAAQGAQGHQTNAAASAGSEVPVVRVDGTDILAGKHYARIVQRCVHAPDGSAFSVNWVGRPSMQSNEYDELFVAKAGKVNVYLIGGVSYVGQGTTNNYSYSGPAMEIHDQSQHQLEVTLECVDRG